MPSADQQPPPDPPRRRRGARRRGGVVGWLRRWLLRPLVWLMVLLIGLLAAAWWTLQTPWAKERARVELVRRLSDVLETPVTVDELDFSLLPPGVTLRGVAIADPDPARPPLFAADRLDVLAGLRRGARWQIQLHSVLADKPVVRLRRLPDGTWNLPHLEGDPAAEPRFEIHIGLLEVRHGLFVLEEQRLPLDLSAREVAGRFLGDGPDAAFGDVRASEIELLLPRARPYLGRMSGRVRVSRTGLDVHRAQVDGPHLEARVQGRVDWEKGEQRASFTVEASGDGQLLDALGYFEDQVRGRFEARLQVLWEPEMWGVRGDLTSPELRLFDWPLASLSGFVAVDENSAHVDIAEARFGDGQIDGSVEIDLQDEERPTRVALSAHGVSLEALSQGLGIPVENVFGRVHGTAEYHFALQQPEAGDGRADLRVEAVAGRGPGVPLGGAVPVAIRDGVVEVGELVLSSDTQRLTGGGVFRLAERTGSFDLAIRSSRLGELRHLLPFDTETEPPLWLPRQGRGNLTARVEIAPEHVVTDLRLELTDVTAPGLSAESATGTLRLGEAGVESMRLDLQREDAALLVSGSVPFEDGRASAPPLDLLVEAASWRLADAVPWLPVELPLDGRLDATLRLAGGLESLRGELIGHVEAVELGPVRSGKLDLALRFDPETVQLQEATWRTPAGELRGVGSYSVANETLDFVVTSDPLAIDRKPLSQLGAAGLAGHLTLEARVRGTVAQPGVEVMLGGDDLRLATGEALPPAQARLRWAGGELEAAAHLHDRVTLDGGGELTWETADLELRVAGQQLGTMVQAAGVSLPGELDGELSGTLTIRRQAGEPAPRVALVLDRLEARYAEHVLTNLEPVEIRLERDAVRIDSLYLGSGREEDELFVGGTIGLGEPHALDLHLQSSLPLAWLELVVPQLEVSGQLDLLAKIGGTFVRPRLNGQGEVRAERVILEGFPHSVERLAGVLLLYPDQMVVDQLDARFAGGRLRIAGAVRPQEDHPLGWGYRFQIEGDGLELRYPADWRLRGDARLVLQSTPEGRELTGVVELDRVFYLKDVGVGPIQLLQDFLRRNPQRFADTDETLRSTQLQIQVLGPDALRVRNNLADLTGDIELVVRGSAAKPVLFGQVTVHADSELSYGGNVYRVERAELIFANPYRIDPYIDLVAETEIQQYDVTLTLDGNLARPNATFSSSPPLADLDVLALVTGGSPTTTEQGTGAAEGFLYGQAAGLVSERVNALFGLDKFRIDPLTTTSGALSQARVTVGEQISRDVLVTYSYDPSTTEQQILQVEWRLSPELSLLLTQNGDDTYAVDARWEKRF